MHDLLTKDFLKQACDTMVVGLTIRFGFMMVLFIIALLYIVHLHH